MFAILLILCVPFAFVESFSANITRVDLAFTPKDSWVALNSDTDELTILKDITEDLGFTVKYEFDQDNDGIIDETEIKFCGVDESSVDGQMVGVLLKALSVKSTSCPISAQTAPDVREFAAELTIDDKVDKENCMSSWSIRMSLKSPELKEPVIDADFFIQNNDCDYEKVAEELGLPEPKEEEEQTPPEDD